MIQRVVSFTLLFLLIANASFAGKRRAVSPGIGRCLYGPLVDGGVIFSLAVDATDVYYYDYVGLAIYRVSKDGGLRSRVAVVNPDLFVTDLVVDDTTVFFGVNPGVESGVVPPGAIYAVPKSGREVRSVAENVNWPIDLKVDGTHVYWASFGTYDTTTDFLAPDGKVERVRKDGGERQTLVQSLSAPYALLLDGDNVIFSESGTANGPVTKGIRRVAKSGGAVAHLQDTHHAADLAETNTDIIFHGASSDLATVGLFRLPKSGGSVQLLVDEEEISGGPRVIDGQTYFAVGADLIQRVPLIGGTPQTIVVGVSEVATLYFEVDACAVYFATESGQLRKAPR